MSGTAADLLSVARSQIGVRETGGGTNGNRQKYSDDMKMPTTEWCAIFVSWCLREARVSHAYAATRVTLFARHYAALDLYYKAPRPGDLVCYDWGMNGAYDHIGIVESVRSDGRLITIEGNTNPGNGQDGVYRMVRSTSSVRGYCRPHYAKAPAKPSPAKPSTSSTYTVRPGDTLSLIGGRLGIKWQTIASLNRIRRPYTIRAGQRLRLTAAPVATPRPASTASHTVTRGQTLGGIAAKYGVTVARLRQLNPWIRNVNLIRIGQRIRYR